MTQDQFSANMDKLLQLLYGFELQNEGVKDRRCGDQTLRGVFFPLKTPITG